MSEANTLPTGSGLQVAEVAYMPGFEDAIYFNRFFQRHAGQPPGKFRQAAFSQKSAPLFRRLAIKPKTIGAHCPVVHGGPSR